MTQSQFKPFMRLRIHDEITLAHFPGDSQSVPRSVMSGWIVLPFVRVRIPGSWRFYRVAVAHPDLVDENAGGHQQQATQFATGRIKADDRRQARNDVQVGESFVNGLWKHGRCSFWLGLKWEMRWLLCGALGWSIHPVFKCYVSLKVVAFP